MFGTTIKNKDEIINEIAWLMHDLCKDNIGFTNWTQIAEELYSRGYIVDEQEIIYEDFFTDED